jgi:hypothetical protein
MHYNMVYLIQNLKFLEFVHMFQHHQYFDKANSYDIFQNMLFEVLIHYLLINKHHLINCLYQLKPMLTNQFREVHHLLS